MTDIAPSAAALVTLDGSRPAAALSPADAALESLVATPAAEAGDTRPTIDRQASVPPPKPSEFDSTPHRQPFAPSKLREKKGRVALTLRPEVLRFLRFQKLMSQQDIADDCWRRNIRLSIATIKRAEVGRSVSFRTALAFAKCYDVPAELLLLTAPE